MTPTRAPIAHDPEAGARAIAACAPPADWAEVVAGAGGSSPHLAALLAREADWMSDVWAADPAAVLDDLVEAAAAEGDPKTLLRVAKRRAALLVALADLGGVWDTMTVCDALTRFADAAVARCLSFALARQKGLPAEPGLAAFAMGKMGAGELNYSSDVDLVLLCDQDRYGPGRYAEARAAMIRAARLACGLLSDITPDGYVFRTDLRLRPDPASTPIVQSMEAAERYYEAVGRTWERAAWIKARSCAGDDRAAARFLGALRPFVWRRHLDFAAVQDAHDMRLAIRDAKGMRGAWDVPGHDLKLGQGGIREIEFFAQTRQLIAGGRDPALRARDTLGALDALRAAGWVEPDAATTLTRVYRRLRDVEHRLQMVRDEQTHRMPDRPDEIARVAHLSGEADPDAFAAALRADLRAVEAITDPFFRPDEPPATAVPSDDQRAAVARWPTYPALRTARARATFERLRPGLLARLGASARPDEALAAFDGFLRGLPAGAQLFALFEANPRLVDLVVDICATAPDLARHLASNAAVLDAVLDGSFFAPLGDATPPPLADGYERAIDDLRRWHREEHFRIGVHLLRRLADPDEVARAYAGLAATTVRAALAIAEDETARRYGRVRGMRTCVLAMGSLGAGRLTPRSDLDLVVIHDGGEGPSSGRRALAAPHWAARLTQALVTTLSARTGAGRLYEVDMRLRPSGRQGPVAVALPAWRAYQASDSWLWEHLALTRARAVAGDGATCEAVEAARRGVIAGGRFDAAAVRRGCVETIDRLRAARPGGAGIAVRSGPGRLQEVELMAQAHALSGRRGARDVTGQLDGPGVLDETDRQALAEVHAVLSTVSTCVRLLTASDPPALDGGGSAFLAEATGHPDLAAVARACDAAAARAADVIARARGGGLD